MSVIIAFLATSVGSLCGGEMVTWLVKTLFVRVGSRGLETTATRLRQQLERRKQQLQKEAQQQAQVEKALEALPPS